MDATFDDAEAIYRLVALTETRLLPAKTQRFIEFLRDRLEDA